MKELADVLERQAAGVHPAPNLGDVYRRADRRRRLGHVGRVAVTVFAVVAAIATMTVVVRARSHGDELAVRSSTSPSEVRVQSLGGLVITGQGADLVSRRGTLERSDPDAPTGPRTAIVRRIGGSLGAASAAVTYPVVDVPQADGELHTYQLDGMTVSVLVVSRPGGRVVVRSATLGANELTAIADATSVIDGRPEVSLPNSMRDLAVVAAGTTRPPIIREARYGCEDLGEGAKLGSLCYTGLTTAPGFEDALYKRGYRPGPVVQGHPSVVSTVGGGNATLSWEPRPGVVAYVGYSGNALADEQLNALARLAARTTLLPPAEWVATQPQVSTQTNDW